MRGLSVMSGLRSGPLLAPVLEAALAQGTGRAVAAAVAPIVPGPALVAIAGVGVLDQDLDQRLAAQLACQRPSLGLVDPHQRRLQREAPVHAEVERDLQRLD